MIRYFSILFLVLICKFFIIGQQDSINVDSLLTIESSVDSLPVDTVTESVSFTADEVIRISFVIDSLKSRVSYLEAQNDLSDKLIKSYKENSVEISDLLEGYERYSLIQEAQLSLLDKNIGRYQELIKDEKRPFWDKPIIWAIMGGTTMYVSSKIVANVK